MAALKKVNEFGITMKEAEKRTKELSAAAEEKAEPQDESEIMCYYHGELKECPGPMGDERSYVIIGDELVMAHKRCQQKSKEGKKTPSVIIR